MSLGIVFKGPEGIVLAADSRVTLTARQIQVEVDPATGMQHQIVAQIPATFDTATKLLFVPAQPHVGIVTYGLSALGQTEPRTAHSYMPEFEVALAKAGNQSGGKTKRLNVGPFAQKLSDFFMGLWTKSMPEHWQADPMVFFVAGYDVDAPYGRVFQLVIPHMPQAQEILAGDFGILRGGQATIVNRLLSGYDEQFIAAIVEALQLDQVQAEQLVNDIAPKLQLPIPYQFLPLQDCVNLCVSLINTTAALQDWSAGIRGVGGAVDVATITRMEGFQPVQMKSIHLD